MFATDDSPPVDSALTYYEDIQPIYQEHCGACHAGCAPDACAGDTCFATYYEALLFPALAQGVLNVAEYGLYRMQATKRDPALVGGLVGPDTLPLIVPDEDIATVERWLLQGMPMGTPPPSASANCVPDCEGKECGCDGCGSLCEGTCPDGFFCSHDEGVCSILNESKREFGPDCVPSCENKECGSDGCGGVCPDLCSGHCDHQTGTCTPSKGD